jgi:hypothetical protein
MDELFKQWNAGKATMKPSSDAEVIIQLAKSKKKTILDFHYGNIVVLSITFIVIGLFFFYVTPFRDILSRIGVGLMLGGLLLRIIIEVFSIMKSKKVQLTNDSSSTTDDAIAFYAFRKKVHGPVTITIVVLYMLGFFFLSPEFSRYIPMKWMIIMDGSFVIGAFILIWVIRKGIKDEMTNLEELIEVRKEMADPD